MLNTDWIWENTDQKKIRIWTLFHTVIKLNRYSGSIEQHCIEHFQFFDRLSLFGWSCSMSPYSRWSLTNALYIVMRDVEGAYYLIFDNTYPLHFFLKWWLKFNFLSRQTPKWFWKTFCGWDDLVVFLDNITFWAWLFSSRLKGIFQRHPFSNFLQIFV